MRRRIVAVTVLAAVLAITLFGVPLAIGVTQYYADDVRAELERKADSAALRLAPELLRGEQPERPAHGVALYEVSGAKVTGHGPPRLDRPLTFLAPDAVEFADTPDKLVVLVAIGDGSSQVLGVVRAALPRSIVYERSALTWLGMAALGGLAIVATWAIARRQARRLAAPLEALSAAARRLGGGDFTVRAERAGIPEIDSVGSSLDSTARRLADLLAKERAFSADASHQLRTPLAGLRLQLESAVDDPDSDPLTAISASLATTDRLERTIDDLLALARDTGTGGESADAGQVLDELVRDWQGLFAGRGRVVHLAGVSDVAGYLVSAPVLRQIVSVLLDNALRHGHGTVTVSARDAGAAVAVDVTDEGAGFLDGADPADGHGRGLALARRLAEAEGGRLRLAHPAPPTFTLLLPTRPTSAP